MNPGPPSSGPRGGGQRTTDIEEPFLPYGGALMPERVVCPACGMAWTVLDGQFGTRMTCLGCRATFEARPTPEEVTPLPEEVVLTEDAADAPVVELVDAE